MTTTMMTRCRCGHRAPSEKLRFCDTHLWFVCVAHQFMWLQNCTGIILYYLPLNHAYQTASNTRDIVSNSIAHQLRIAAHYRAGSHKWHADMTHFRIDWHRMHRISASLCVTLCRRTAGARTWTEILAHNIHIVAAAQCFYHLTLHCGRRRQHTEAFRF